MKEGLLTQSSAIISSDGRFRYHLVRRWKTLGPNLCFIMLNPSKADGTVDDATLRRCMDFARRWGYSGVIVVNLFAFRSTSPKPLKLHTTFIGAMNDYHILDAVAGCDKVVCAWGAHPLAFRRSRQVGDKLEEEGLSDRLYCLGLTSQDSPRHPLYASKFVQLEKYVCPTSRLRIRLLTNRSPDVKTLRDRRSGTKIRGEVQGSHRKRARIRLGAD